MNKFLLFTIIFSLSINSFSQDYFIIKNDTTFCNKLKYTTSSQGYLKKLEFINLSGIETTLKGKKNVSDVSTIYLKGNTFDKIPLKASKPKSYVRFTKRVVDGKLKVYLMRQKTITTIRPTSSTKIAPNTTLVTHYGPEKGAAGNYRFFIKLPNGTFYKVNKKKNIEKYIEPYLLKCEEFKKQFKGFHFDRAKFAAKGSSLDENEQHFIEQIELYNSLCN